MVERFKARKRHGRNCSVRALEVHPRSVPYGLVLYRRSVEYRALTAAKLLVLASKDADKEIAGTTPPPSFGLCIEFY